MTDPTKATKVLKPIVPLECLRCGNVWYPRSPEKPKQCANKKCRSPYWDKPRQKRARPRVTAKAGKSSGQRVRA